MSLFRRKLKFKHSTIGLIILIGQLLFPQIQANDDLVNFERVLSLQEDQTRLTYSEYLLALEVENELYVNLQEFIISLGFNLSVNENEYRFEWSDKDQEVLIRINECYYEINQKQTSFNCNNLINYDNEGYLSLKVLNQLLNSEVKYRPLKSLLIISSTVEFPKLKINKLKRNVVTSPNRNSFNPDVSFNPDYSWLNGFSYYQELDYRYNNTRRGKTLNHYGVLDAELGNMGLKVINSGDQNNFENQWISLKRESPTNNLLNPLGASKVTIGNFIAQPVKHIPSTGKIMGLNIHNRPLNNQKLTRLRTFEGDIDPGWIVELYRNNVLIDKKTNEEDGRYRFEKVPLEYGLNQFVFIFYGPSGEERREERTFFLDEKTLSNQPLTFDLALGQDSNSNMINLLRTDIPISALHSASFAHYNSSDLKITQSEFSTHFWNTSLTFSGAKDQNGGLYGAEILKRFSGLNLRGEFFQYDDFIGGEEDNINLRNRLQASLSFSLFPRTQHLIDYTKEKRIEERSEQSDILRYRVSHNLGSLYLNNAFLYRRNKKTINSLLRFRSGPVQPYIESSYDTQDHFESYTLGLRYKKGRERSVAAFFKRTIDQDLNTFNISALKYFSKIMARLSFNTSFKGDTQVALSLASSLFAHPQRSHYSLRSRFTKEVGDILIKTYLESDQNKKGIENVCMNSLTTRERHCSNKNGHIHIKNLPTHSPIKLKLEFTDLDNFYINSDKKNFEVYVRPGITTSFDVPLTIYGEVEGNVYTSEHNLRKYEVKIVGMENEFETTLRTDSDGYFYLSQVSPGHYKSILIKNKTPVQTQEFIMPNDGDLIAISFNDD